MEINQDSRNKESFLSHVFSTTDEDKGEMLNIVQYSTLAIIPILLLNKFINRFIPEADPDKSSIELLVEILIQLIIIFIGIILVHRIITYIPTYSGFKYENLILTNVILAFLIIVFSIQSKIGLKANILFDRTYELWNGPSDDTENDKPKKRAKHHSAHTPSQADHLDNPALQNELFPPAPVAVQRPVQEDPSMQYMSGPMAANSLLGGSFGASF
tara:strand:- start:8207 stop:8851 length:645 start_codon:yes stop_codon:yes gene_type:complete